MRQIYIVNAIQVVVSDQNPQGVYSTYKDPIKRDSRDYERTEANPNGNEEIAMIVAQADYADIIKQLSTANNPSRVGWAVTLERWDGVQIAKKSWGAFPDMTPSPAPESEI